MKYYVNLKTNRPISNVRGNNITNEPEDEGGEGEGRGKNTHVHSRNVHAEILRYELCDLMELVRRCKFLI